MKRLHGRRQGQSGEPDNFSDMKLNSCRIRGGVDLEPCLVSRHK